VKEREVTDKENIHVVEADGGMRKASIKRIDFFIINKASKHGLFGGLVLRLGIAIL
jgi:hypothetical protein